MSFLNPWMWLFAAGLAVPILIHLTRKPSSRSVLFPSLFFLRRLPIRERRRRRIQHPWLLLLRCLVVLLLVAAFAEPVWIGPSQAIPLTRPPHSHLLVVDVSHSMAVPRVQERLREELARILDGIGPADEVAAVVFADRARIVKTWESPDPGLQSVPEEWVRPGFGATRLDEALRVAAELAEEAKRPAGTIYVFSDFQRSGHLPSPADNPLPAGWSVVPIDVGVPARNVYIEDVRVESELFEGVVVPPLLVKLRAGVRGDGAGEEDREQGSLVLFLDDRETQAVPYRMDASGEVGVQVPGFRLTQELVRGRLEIRPERADALATDNRFYFTVRRSEPFDVLVVGSEGREGAGMLETALSAGENLPYRVRREETAALNDATRVVVWYDQTTPPPREVLQWVRQGGCLVLVLGPSANPARWSGTPGVPRPGERLYIRDSERAFATLTWRDPAHPFTARLGEQESRALEAVEFFAFRALELTGEDRVVLRAGELPVLVERPVGAGRILAFASTADPRWNDFPLRGGFVPFWQELVEFGAGRPRLPPYRRVGDSVGAEAALIAAPSPDSWSLVDPDGEIRRGDGAAVALEKPGYHEVRFKGGTSWIAVNLPPSESDLAPAAPALLDAWRIQGRGSGMETDQSPEAAARPARPWELWWSALLLALALAVAEVWLANRIGRSRAPARPAWGEES
ncbi:MAG: hypothetical protein Kow00109_12690 [Acidobacteriota bacterium]